MPSGELLAALDGGILDFSGGRHAWWLRENDSGKTGKRQQAERRVGAKCGSESVLTGPNNDDARPGKGRRFALRHAMHRANQPAAAPPPPAAICGPPIAATGNPPTISVSFGQASARTPGVGREHQREARTGRRLLYSVCGRRRASASRPDLIASPGGQWAAVWVHQQHVASPAFAAKRLPSSLCPPLTASACPCDDCDCDCDVFDPPSPRPRDPNPRAARPDEPPAPKQLSTPPPPPLLHRTLIMPRPKKDGAPEPKKRSRNGCW